LPFPALAEHGELDPDSLAGMRLPHRTLHPHRQLPHAKGHLHGLPFAETIAIAQMDQAAAQAQVRNSAAHANPGRETPNLRLSAALKPMVSPSIVLLLRQSSPLRVSAPEKIIGCPGKCMRKAKGDRCPNRNS
jgi:hypothetical protein